MEQIKNRAGQVFADFDEWKKWAEQPSEQHPDHNNVLPELVRFLGLYPHLLDSSVSELVEQCTENIPEDFYDQWTLDDDEEVIVSLSFNSDRVIYDTLEELSPDLALRYAKHAIITGDNANKIYSAIKDFTKAEIQDDFEVAVMLGMEYAKAVGTLLLSPASASYDKFKDYRQRGSFFEEIVLKCK
jgi:hypothetical protein